MLTRGRKNEGNIIKFRSAYWLRLSHSKNSEWVWGDGGWGDRARTKISKISEAEWKAKNRSKYL